MVTQLVNTKASPFALKAKRQDSSDLEGSKTPEPASTQAAELEGEKTVQKSPEIRLCHRRMLLTHWKLEKTFAVTS